MNPPPSPDHPVPLLGQAEARLDDAPPAYSPPISAEARDAPMSDLQQEQEEGLPASGLPVSATSTGDLPPVTLTIVPTDELAVPSVEVILPPLPANPTLATHLVTFSLSGWSTILQGEGPDRIESANFSLTDGSRWRLLVFPRGNNGPKDHISVFLVSAEAVERRAAAEKAGSDAPSPTPPDRWAVPAKFSIHLPNSHSPAHPKVMVGEHRFCAADTDWGFSTMAKHYELRNFTRDNTLTIRVYLRVMEDKLGTLFHRFESWDSRRETGYVGILNQGATCYMNSLLQSLYFIPYFRRATYQIPTDSEAPGKSIPLALQRLFFGLEHSSEAVGTTELTASFGWDTRESFMQHDVQEFNRVLQDNLEAKMKGTAAEGAISKLFVGKMKSFIKCCDVDFESSRIEDFYDIQLNVKNCKDLAASFADYCVTETLEGENAYEAEGFGLQKARKGVIFTEFPPVLHLQLKRFEYDMERDMMVKINDRHEFPLEIDLGPYMESAPATPQLYHLHGVLVHSGHLNGGHYFAMIRPTEQNKWFKFDDDRVIPVPLAEVFEANFGGVVGQRTMGKKHSNAYMLVYIRDQDRPTILAPLLPSDIPAHLEAGLRRDAELRMTLAREREEEYLYTTLYLLQDQGIRDFNAGFDLITTAAYEGRGKLLRRAREHPDKPPPPSPLMPVRVPLDGDYRVLLDTVARVTGLTQAFELWYFATRENHTMRPEFLLDTEELLESPELTIRELRERYLKATPDLLLVRPVGQTLPLEVAEQGCLIFLKFYDPASASLTYLGSLLVERRQTYILEALWDSLLGVEMVVHASGHLGPSTLRPEDLLIFEEVMPGMVELIRQPAETTFFAAELVHGDILTVQWRPNPGEALEMPLAPDYYEALLNTVTISFSTEGRADVELRMDKRQPLDDAIRKLAHAIQADPMHVQLAGKYHIPQPLRLMEVLGYGGAPRHQLSYTVLGFPCSELEVKRFIPVKYHQQMYQCFVEKAGTVADVARALCTLANIPEEAQRHLVLCTVGAHSCRLTRLCPPAEPLTQLSEDVMLVAQSIDLAAADRVIPVFHFERDVRFGHGTPFLFPLVRGEGITAMKARMAQSHLAGTMSVKEVARMRMHLVREDVKEVELVVEDALAQSAPSPLESRAPSPPQPFGPPLPLPSSPLLQGVNGAVAGLGLSPAATLPHPPPSAVDVLSSPTKAAPGPGAVSGGPRPVPSPESARFQGPPTKQARSEPPTGLGSVSCLLPLPPAPALLPALPVAPWFPPGPECTEEGEEEGAWTARQREASGDQPTLRAVEEVLFLHALGLEHPDKAKYQRAVSLDHSIKIFN